ncbi:MAG: response regulator, partial [Anaeromyxobacter sp.]|nr:response regulator [Anaeromyxobacter sp.]
GQLGQAIDNLLINAKQAMPGGGRVEVSARGLAPGAPRPADLLPGRRYVVIEVRDHGTGIPPEHLPHVFDPFFTTKQSGSGLGLASVHSIMKKHGGAVEVSSEPGRGACFRLYLPAHEAEVSAAPPGATPSDFTGRTVLVLDDEDYLRDVAGAMLRRLGCDVVLVRDGAEVAPASRLARQQGRPLDAVILDLTIPGGMGGRRALEELRRVEPAVAALASSGYSEDPVIATPASYGFHGSLRKPYVLEELRAALAKALAAGG